MQLFLETNGRNKHNQPQELQDLAVPQASPTSFVLRLGEGELHRSWCFTLSSLRLRTSIRNTRYGIVTCIEFALLSIE